MEKIFSRVSGLPIRGRFPLNVWVHNIVADDVDVSTTTYALSR